MSAVHEGGCACGAVRYRVKNAPFRTSVCHCRACQRRTGSAFGVGIYFKQDDFELLRGELKAYEYRSDETHRWLRIERHVWTRSAHPWVPIPPEVEKFEKGPVQPPATPAR